MIKVSYVIHSALPFTLDSLQPLRIAFIACWWDQQEAMNSWRGIEWALVKIAAIKAQNWHPIFKSDIVYM